MNPFLCEVRLIWGMSIVAGVFNCLLSNLQVKPQRCSMNWVWQREAANCHIWEAWKQCHLCFFVINRLTVKALILGCKVIQELSASYNLNTKRFSLQCPSAKTKTIMSLNRLSYTRAALLQQTCMWNRLDVSLWVCLRLFQVLRQRRSDLETKSLWVSSQLQDPCRRGRCCCTHRVHLQGPWAAAAHWVPQQEPRCVSSTPAAEIRA